VSIVRSTRAVLDWMSVSQHLKYLDSRLTLRGTVESEDGDNPRLIKMNHVWRDKVIDSQEVL